MRSPSPSPLPSPQGEGTAFAAPVHGALPCFFMLWEAVDGRADESNSNRSLTVAALSAVVPLTNKGDV